jgi:hypothetical protein
MLDKKNYELEYIRELQKKYERDPILIERVLFAFGLLETIKRVGMPFTFKGGTSLMLLLSHTMRLSTDIDIIVEPGTDIDYYIEEANKLFPFKRSQEQKRVGKNDIEKRHFKFFYDSPLKNDDFYILLDVLFVKNYYTKTVLKPINNELVRVIEPEIFVSVPNVNCILGDKLTAFAPHTTGISFPKNLEIIKQLYDIATLTDEISDFSEVKDTYRNVVQSEIGYRGIVIEAEDALKDTIQACACIISRGYIEPEEYKLYLSGISKITGHIFNIKYSGEMAAIDACKVMCLAACVLTNRDKMIIINKPEDYLFEKISLKKYSKLSYIKKMKLEAYGYLIEATKIMGNII